MEHKLLILLFGILLFNACNDCHLVDCAPTASFGLEINDMSTGKPLLTSTDSTFHIDSIQIGSIIDGELIDGFFSELWSHTDSSSLFCGLNTQPDIVIVELNPREFDTLRFSSSLIEDECCSYYRLDSVSINNESMMVLQSDLVTILK